MKKLRLRFNIVYIYFKNSLRHLRSRFNIFVILIFLFKSVLKKKMNSIKDLLSFEGIVYKVKGTSPKKIKQKF